MFVFLTAGVRQAAAMCVCVRMCCPVQVLLKVIHSLFFKTGGEEFICVCFTRELKNPIV